MRMPPLSDIHTFGVIIVAEVMLISRVVHVSTKNNPPLDVAVEFVI